MSKHTPGDWHRLLGTAGAGHPRYEEGRVVIRIVQARAPEQTDFVRIALVDSDRPVDDARLIAAAPAMLEALREIAAQDWVENCLDPQWAARIARAAIAAATGEKP